MQLIVGSLGLAEAVTIVQHYRYNTGNYSTSKTFFIGTGLVIAGALVREWCFHTMGSMFTFELGIVQERHRLVVDGPYAFVRFVPQRALT